MPCNCSGVRMKRCSCKVFGYPLAKNKTDNFVLVEEDPSNAIIDDAEYKFNYVFKAFECLYDKCAGYNLRYCRLRVKHMREKHFINTFKDLFVLICFLIANFIVFLNISTRIGVHLYFVFREFLKWLERYAQAAANRHLMKSQCESRVQRPHSEQSPTLSN